ARSRPGRGPAPGSPGGSVPSAGSAPGGPGAGSAAPGGMELAISLEPPQACSVAPAVSGSVQTHSPASTANPAASATPPPSPHRAATAAITSGATNCTPRVTFMIVDMAAPRTRVGKSSEKKGPKHDQLPVPSPAIAMQARPASGRSASTPQNTVTMARPAAV